MSDLNQKEKVINITGICANCSNRISCDFAIGINTYVRDNKYSSHISDAEITVYACDDYKTEVEQICDESDMCISCIQEG